MVINTHSSERSKLECNPTCTKKFVFYQLIIIMFSPYLLHLLLLLCSFCSENINKDNNSVQFYYILQTTTMWSVIGEFSRP